MNEFVADIRLSNYDNIYLREKYVMHTHFKHKKAHFSHFFVNVIITKRLKGLDLSRLKTTLLIHA